MNQMTLLNDIKIYLARFQAQVKISSLNNEYDINIHAENFLIPVLNLVYDLNLKNSNTIIKNSEAIDLIDEEKRIAFQITSTNKIEKIKKTIEKFIKSDFSTRIDTLYVYVLNDRQISYSQMSLNKVGAQKINFSNNNIIDSTYIYSLLKGKNDISLLKKVHQLLIAQFSDLKITDSLTYSEFEEFIHSYSQSCIINFSRINFFGLSIRSNKPREIDINSLFVSPNFTVSKDFRPAKLILENYFTLNDLKPKREKVLFKELQFADFLNKISDSDSRIKLEDLRSRLLELNTITFKKFFNGPQHVVVLGGPGAGKSSMIKYAICKILEKDKNIFDSEDIYEFLPFRIELHKYNKLKRSQNSGIIEYLCQSLTADHQSTLTIKNLKAIINTTPTLFFFDGLDEIFDIQERISVRNDIESFIKTYTNVRTITTSRYESYEEVKLSEGQFAIYELNSFSEKQINEYVKRWYSIEEENEEIRKAEIKNCLSQLNEVDINLINNPLLLSLILLLYRNELDIPTSKLSIYEGCTNTIVDTRDSREKKLDLNLKIVNKNSIFAALAFWQFTLERERKNSLSFNDVKNFITQHILDKGEFDDYSIAENAAVEFLSFAKIRSIYFDNNFTHKTFLEYFTALYVYSYYFGNAKRRPELEELLTKTIGFSSWAVVLELLICKIDSTQIDFDVLDEIVDAQISKNGVDFLIFFLNIIKYLKNVSPKKIKDIIELSIIKCFSENEQTKELNKEYKEVLFNSLCKLNNYVRFQDYILTAFNSLKEKDVISKKRLKIYSLEFAIVSGVTYLIEFNTESTDEDDYIFILDHYLNLFEKDKYLQTLRKKINTYPSFSNTRTYLSNFNQTIFFNKNKFNWILSYFTFYIHTNDFNRLYVDLISVGIKPIEILNSFNKRNDIISDSIIPLKLNFTTSDANLNKLKRIITKVYKIPKMKNVSGKIYDSFYRKFKY